MENRQWACCCSMDLSPLSNCQYHHLHMRGRVLHGEQYVELYKPFCISLCSPLWYIYILFTHVLTGTLRRAVPGAVQAFLYITVQSSVMYLQPVYTCADRCFMESSTWSCTSPSLHQALCSPLCEWLTFWIRDPEPSFSIMVSDETISHPDALSQFSLLTDIMDKGSGAFILYNGEWGNHLSHWRSFSVQFTYWHSG